MNLDFLAGVLTGVISPILIAYAARRITERKAPKAVAPFVQVSEEQPPVKRRRGRKPKPPEQPIETNEPTQNGKPLKTVNL